MPCKIGTQAATLVHCNLITTIPNSTYMYITEKVLFLKKSFSENSGTISEMGFISVRVLMTKVRYTICFHSYDISHYSFMSGKLLLKIC